MPHGDPRSPHEPLARLELECPTPESRASPQSRAPSPGPRVPSESPALSPPVRVPSPESGVPSPEYDPPPIECPPVRRPVLTLVFIACFSFLLGLGRPAISDSDEGFYAE